MTTLAEIENAVAALSWEQKHALCRFLVEQLADVAAKAPLPPAHGVLDIPTVHLGPVLPLSSDEDLLDEMLQDRT